jgi:hypothetical protein
VTLLLTWRADPDSEWQVIGARDPGDPPPAQAGPGQWRTIDLESPDLGTGVTTVTAQRAATLAAVDIIDRVRQRLGLTVLSRQDAAAIAAAFLAQATAP